MSSAMDDLLYQKSPYPPQERDFFVCIYCEDEYKMTKKIL